MFDFSALQFFFFHEINTFDLNRSVTMFVFVQETWYWPGAVNADGVVMSGVRCAGTEMTLSHCLHHGEYLSCPKGGGRFAAGVSCSESKRIQI